MYAAACVRYQREPDCIVEMRVCRDVPGFLPIFTPALAKSLLHWVWKLMLNTKARHCVVR
jgi:hypothetical protein